MILQVQKGCFGYPGQPVILENIDLTLEEGHILAILGPNGIGKTTLLKCMIGLLPWHSGKTLLYGKDIHTLKPKEVWSTISYIRSPTGLPSPIPGWRWSCWVAAPIWVCSSSPVKRNWKWRSHDGAGGHLSPCQQGLQPDERRRTANGAHCPCPYQRP